jgi:hypothetical protein
LLYSQGRLAFQGLSFEFRKRGPKGSILGEGPLGLVKPLDVRGVGLRPIGALSALEERGMKKTERSFIFIGFLLFMVCSSY